MAKDNPDRFMDALDYAFRVYFLFFIFVIVYFCKWVSTEPPHASEKNVVASHARERSPCRSNPRKHVSYME